MRLIKVIKWLEPIRRAHVPTGAGREEAAFCLGLWGMLTPVSSLLQLLVIAGAAKGPVGRLREKLCALRSLSAFTL